MDPSYNDTAYGRPRMQIYHGSHDTTLAPEIFEEEIKQWTGVLSYDALSPQQVVSNSPRQGWTTSIWGTDELNPLGRVRGVLARGVGHPVPVDG